MPGPRFGPPPGPPPGPPRRGPPRPPAPRAWVGCSAWDCCLGIIAGLGRGMPEVPPGRGIRWPSPPVPPGRGLPSRAPGPGRPPAGAPPSGRGRRTPMPCDGANGLLPGRGAPPWGRGRGVELGSPPLVPGRGAGWPPGAGRCCAPRASAAPGRGAAAGRGVPGRGATAPGRGAAPGRGGVGLSPAPWGAAGRSTSTGSAGVAGACATASVGAAAAGSAATGAAAAGLAAPGRGAEAPGRGAADGRAPGRGAPGRAAPAELGPGLSVVDDSLAPVAPLPSVSTASFRRRTTGASTVEEAERTNSPMPFNFSSTSLLSSPSSFASS